MNSIVPKAKGPLVVLAASGTGGHMFPAEALARALLARSIRVALITDRRGQAFGEALPEVAVHRIRTGRLSRSMVARLQAVTQMGLGFIDARRILKQLEPDVVVGFGGYPSIPTVVAAVTKRIPVVLHEQNAMLGRANRRLAAYARAVASSFPKVAGLPAGFAPAFTGNPVRPGILAVREQPYAAPVADGKLRILVMGGSQGAHVFSEVMPAAAALLPEVLRARLSIVQQCRPEDIDEVRKAYAAAGIDAELSTFFTDMPQRLSACHLAIARSGASTVAELGVAGRPAILVPYPFATDDHQRANADAFADNGGAWIIGQRSFSPLLVAERLESLLRLPETLVRAAAGAREAGKPDAAERLADLVAAQVAVKQGTLRLAEKAPSRPTHALWEAAE